MARSDARKKLIEKIQSLLNPAGRSETEIAMALGLARRLMEEHDLRESDLQFGGETVTAEKKFRSDFDRIRDRLCTSVGRFCNCASWGTRGETGTTTYCGLESEVIFAHWLLDMLGDFVVRELENYARSQSTGRLTRIERESFILGCVGRIAQRLEELAPKRPVGNGRDLVLTRQALIRKYMEEHGIKLREPFKLYQLDVDANAAGVAAGDRAQFNKPVNGAGQRLLGNGR